MSTLEITRMEDFGPDGSGLETWEQINPDDLAEGTPVQRGKLYLDDKATGLSAGVWDCTPMTSKLAPYDVNEFMYVLDGSVTIVHEDGTENTIRAGQSFIIPKGTPCIWKQTEYIRKFFVIFDDPSGEMADADKLHVILPEPKGELSPAPVADPSIFSGAVPEQREHVWFEDPTGQMTVGVWESTPFTKEPGPFNRCELMLVLDGEMTLTGDNGTHTFRPGEAAVVPKGATYGWTSTETVRKIYCIFMEREAAAGAAAAE